MDTELFEKAYGNLNAEQKAAVDAVEGPVMVIAGPGTGKTQILTLRIANILAKTDTPADAILALTFTESAAANMRRRLVALIGSRGYYVAIHTFHGFCNRIIQDYPEYFPEIIGGKNASAVDQISILREILAETSFEHLTPIGDRFFYVPPLLAAIRAIKSEGLSCDDFAVLLEKEKERFGDIPDLYHTKGAHKGKMKGEYRKQLTGIEKNEELGKVYRAYQATLENRRLYDFEDMILRVVRALASKEDFLLEIQEAYHYILVDEHQDTNGAQNKVLESIASFYPNPNLFVVGDEKQAIFRFQGASLENFLYFKEKYPAVRLVNLTTNYRSTQAILDSAGSLISHNKATIAQNLRSSQSEEGTPLRIVSFETAAGEIYFLSEEAAKRIREGESAEEIAILYRENRDAFRIAELLAKRGIPHAVESDDNLLQDADIEKLILLFRAVDGFGDDEQLIEALHVDFLGIDPLDIYKLVTHNERSDLSLHDILAKRAVGDLGLLQKEKIFEAYEKLRLWNRKSRNTPFLLLFEEMVRDSGLLTSLLSYGDAFEKMEKLEAFFGEAKKLVGSDGSYRLRNFMKHLEILRSHGVSIKGKARRGSHAVRLMTAHRAKGLEFNHVYVTGVTDGHWGNKYSRATFALPFETSVELGNFEKNEDERRLFYMALTRARKSVTITYALRAEDERERVPSQFLEEIKPELKNEESGVEYELRRQKDHAELFAPRSLRAPRIHEKDFLRELFRTRGLSPTHLNNYLRCPWEYFYKNLIRIPSVPTPTQIYGTAVHEALQDFFTAAKRDGKAPDPTFLVSRFDARLSKSPIPPREAEMLKKKAHASLVRYAETYAPVWNYRVFTEFNVNGVMLADEVKITGKLDKIELEEAGNVVVVDYKTSKPQSRNWIEGNVGDSNGDYKRQLVFYKLLLNLYPEQKYRMVAGVIDFVEPNERGTFKKERFEIREEEVEDLVATILKVADEITSLSFWNRRCEDSACRYCRLRDMLHS